jgi:hypothetical protein
LNIFDEVGAKSIRCLTPGASIFAPRRQVFNSFRFLPRSTSSTAQRVRWLVKFWEFGALLTCGCIHKGAGFGLEAYTLEFLVHLRKLGITDACCH